MNVVLVLAKAIVYVVMSAYARPQELLSSRQQTLVPCHQGDHQALLAPLGKASTPSRQLEAVKGRYGASSCESPAWTLWATD
jgi:hypothetical protein